MAHATQQWIANNPRLYSIWGGIKKRCRDKGDKRYGGRGITLCEEWLSFPNFCRWSLTHGYADELQIDRIDNDGNYEPSNCRWVTRLVNMHNTERSNMQREWKYLCVKHGLNYSKVLYIKRRDKSTWEQAFNEALAAKRWKEFKEWAHSPAREKWYAYVHEAEQATLRKLRNTEQD